MELTEKPLVQRLCLREGSPSLSGGEVQLALDVGDTTWYRERRKSRQTWGRSCGELESRRAVATHAKVWVLLPECLRYVLIPRANRASANRPDRSKRGWTRSGSVIEFVTLQSRVNSAGAITSPLLCALLFQKYTGARNYRRGWARALISCRQIQYAQ